MAQRLVLQIDKTALLGQFKQFVERAESIGFGPRAEVNLTVVDGTYRFWLHIPEGKRSVIRKTVKKTKTELAVEKQIADHKKRRANGEKIAHVPPVKGTTKRKVVKKKTTKA